MTMKLSVSSLGLVFEMPFSHEAGICGQTGWTELDSDVKPPLC